MVDVDILTLLSNRPSVRVDTGYWNACVSSFQKYLGQFQPNLAQISCIWVKEFQFVDIPLENISFTCMETSSLDLLVKSYKIKGPWFINYGL